MGLQTQGHERGHCESVAKCFGLADGYQLVGEVMAHQGDDGLPCFIVGSQHQSISPASAGNDRG
ncbi:hypothetical protein DP180_19435 [Enterobacter kobei]|nr:hypothetical protein DP180_19435 [Enterobacter kobei]